MNPQAKNNALQDDDDDDFDMFNPSAAAPTSPSPISTAAPPPSITGTKSTMEVKHVEDLTDPEGYLSAPPGTTIRHGEYEICGELGRGVFSTVFLVKRIPKKGEDEATTAAMKVSRANETMYKAGLKELHILKEIGPHPHVIRLLESFELDTKTVGGASGIGVPHLILVFERMEMNLRETLNKFGQNVGLSLAAVRTFGRQLFSALARLRELQIVHADFKPDNILVSPDLRRCVLGDLGSAFHLTDPEANQPTPYLVSRYYRSPEIILGLPYGCEADVWALGVTLFELFTGKVLFPGQKNNDMLNFFHQTLGRIPNAMVRRHIQVYETKLELEPHYDLVQKEFRFKMHDRDPVTQSVIRRLVKVPDHPVPAKSLKGMVVLKGMEEEDDHEALLDFANALEQCLTLDPSHRIDPRTALDKLKFFSTAQQSSNKKLKSVADVASE